MAYPPERVGHCAGSSGCRRDCTDMVAHMLMHSPERSTAASSAYRTLLRAAAWVDQHIDLFTPHDANNNPLFGEDSIKFVSELAFACICGLESDIAEIKPFIERFTRHINQFIDREAFALLLIEHQLFIGAYLQIHRLNQLSRHSGVISNQLLQTLLDTTCLSHPSRVPFRTMDLAYSIERAGLRHALPPLAALYRTTLAAGSLHLPALTTYDVYCFTHTIFYLTDMGQALPAYLGAAELQRLRQACHLLTGMYLRGNDLDLLGELLICLYQLGKPARHTAEVAWRRIEQTQDAEGFVPGPYFSRERQASLSGQARRRYTFLQTYHTTLVAMVAGFQTLLSEQRHGALAAAGRAGGHEPTSLDQGRPVLGHHRSKHG